MVMTTACVAHSTCPAHLAEGNARGIVAKCSFNGPFQSMVSFSFKKKFCILGLLEDSCFSVFLNTNLSFPFTF